MNLKDITVFFDNDLQLMAAQAKKILKKNIKRLDGVINDILTFEGKNIRAMLLLIFSRNKNSDNNLAPFYSAALELLHFASLIHDDIIDNAKTRRKKDSVNNIYGNNFAVLSGDYISIRVLREVANKGNKQIFKEFLKRADMLIRGEVDQSLNGKNMNLKEEDYYSIIDKKTGSLFEFASVCGVLLKHHKDEELKIAENFGKHFGRAFQIADDITDIIFDKEISGKDNNKDFQNKIITLPFIHLFNKNNGCIDPKENIFKVEHNKLIEKLTVAGSFEYACKKVEENLNISYSAAEKILDFEEIQFVKTIGNSIIKRIKEEVCNDF